MKQLPEFVDFSQGLVVRGDTTSKVAARKETEELALTYLSQANYIAVVGAITLQDFARFTSKEDQTNDTITVFGQDRVYLTGLKRRAVYRRISEGILRSLNDEYSCATPDHQCLNCYNCYLYGGLIGDEKGVRSRLKPTTAYSIQSTAEALADEEEFHIMVHRNLRMPEAGASIYNLHLIRPGTVFPFIDFVFHPSQLDLAVYFETLKQAAALGFGSRTSLMGACRIDVFGLTEDLCFGYRELLDSVAVEAGAPSLADDLRSQLEDATPATWRTKLPDLLEAHRDAIYGPGKGD